DTLCEALAQRGATPLPVFCASLRSADSQLAALLNPADAVITTVLAAGGSAAADGTGEGDWDAGLLAGLDVPVLQGLCLTSSRAHRDASYPALAPIAAPHCARDLVRDPNSTRLNSTHGSISQAVRDVNR